MTRAHRRAAGIVFVTLWLSSAYFWHARDWNVSSRLMLTYALADRGTVRINGLEDHTGDRARIGRDYFTDKLPGVSLLAVPPYLAARAVLGLPDHPLNVPGDGFTHWPADYWITLATSGAATALTGALLTLLAGGLGCGPRRAGLVGLAYGLATPAYVYGTLAYGHQPAACALLASFALIRVAPGRSRTVALAALAGFLAALAAVIELQVGPVSALLGLYLVGMVAGRRLPARCVPAFGLGALGPTLVLLAYNQFAFGSPFDMGYFHEDAEIFREVHSAGNPLGLGAPDWSKVGPLLWGGYRGLLFYAPIVALAPLGWVVLGVRRRWGTLWISVGASLAVFLVNLSYPQWTGGFSTGPRLLVPLLPFAMLGVAAALGLRRRAIDGLAIGLACLGGVLMLLFQGAGGRVPSAVADPLRDFVLPIWQGAIDPHLGAQGFARNLASVLAPEWVAGLPAGMQWVQFAPLVGIQTMAILLLLIGAREPVSREPITPQSAVRPPGG